MKKRDRQLQIRFREEEYQQLAELAEQDCRSVSGYVRYVLKTTVLDKPPAGQPTANAKATQW